MGDQFWWLRQHLLEPLSIQVQLLLQLDEVWLYASNPSGAQRTLTIQWGGTTSPNDHFVLFLPAQSGLIVIAPGLIIKGNATPLVVRAFCDSANQVNISGYVNEIA